MRTTPVVRAADGHCRVAQLCETTLFSCHCHDVFLDLLSGTLELEDAH